MSRISNALWVTRRKGLEMIASIPTRPNRSPLSRASSRPCCVSSGSSLHPWQRPSRLKVLVPWRMSHTTVSGVDCTDLLLMRVPHRLAVEHGCILAVPSHEAFVGPAYPDPPFAKKEYKLRTPGGLQVVGDEQCRVPNTEPIQGRSHFPFVLPVQPGGGLIENRDGCFANGGPGNGDSLPLSARQGGPVLAHDGVVLPGHLLDEVVRIRHARRKHDFVRARGRGPECNVVVHADGEQRAVLHHDADLGAKRLQGVVADIPPVNQDPSVRGIVETQQQARQRRLAAAGGAHQHYALARFDYKTDVPQNWVTRFIGEGNVLEADASSEASRGHRVGFVLDLRSSAQ